MSDDQAGDIGNDDGHGDDGANVPAARPAETIDHASGEIVPASESGIAFAEVIGDAAITEYLQDMSGTEDETPEAIQLQIARRILAANDVESVWQATKVLSARDILNTPIIIERVRWITSAHKGGAPKYAIIEGLNGFDQKPVTISCGAMNVVLTVYKLQKFSALPCKVMITSKPSGSDPGRSVLEIQPVAG